jgi:hypothetical protein
LRDRVVTVSGVALSLYLRQLALEVARGALCGLPFQLALEVTGRPMRGFVVVRPAGCEDDALARWVARAAAFASGLPAK